MTKQEIFDHQCRHFAKQQCRATSDRQADVCAYINDDGCMCAVGCLFNKEELENHGRTERTVTALDGLRPFFTEHIEYLQDSQAVHDAADGSADNLKFMLSNLAERHDLSRSVIHQIQVWNG